MIKLEESWTGLEIGVYSENDLIFLWIEKEDMDGTVFYFPCQCAEMAF